jgi:MOSC domain-containing protein YiiM
MAQGRDVRSGSGEVVEINISPEHERLPRPVNAVRAVAGRGLDGDRYFMADGEPVPDRQEDLTLIATEALEALREEHAIELTAAESRRNVATRGIDLNALVGKRFRVGGVECRGIVLCEPCRDMERLTQPGVLKGMVHRAGLNAAILSDGEISVGDSVTELDA